MYQGAPHLAYAFPGAGVLPSAFGTVLVDIDFNRADLITLNAGKVSQINGASGTAYNFSQATGANQPAYTASGANFRGRGYASFAGGQLLTSTAAVNPGGATKMTVAVVLYRNGTTGTTQIVFEVSGNVTSFTGTMACLIGNFAADGWEADVNGAAAAQFAQRRANGISDAAQYRLITSANYSTANNASLTQRANGTAVGTINNATFTTTTVGTHTWYIGARAGVAVPARIDLARLIAYTGTVDETGLDAWLAGLYG